MRGSHALSFDNPHITQEACSTREKKKKKKKKTLDDSDNVSGVLLLFKITYKARNKISNVVWVYLCVLLIFSGFLLEHLAVGCHSSSFTRISLTILWVIVRWGFFFTSTWFQCMGHNMLSWRVTERGSASQWETLSYKPCLRSPLGICRAGQGTATVVLLYCWSSQSILYTQYMGENIE